MDVDITFKGWGEVHNSKKLYARGLARRMIEKDFGLKDLMETRNFASEHYEQAGSYTGTMRIGDRTIELGNATGHRDHSWGARDMTAAKSWTWLTVQFEEGMAVNVASFKAGKLDIMGGYIYRNGRNRALRDIRTRNGIRGRRADSEIPSLLHRGYGRLPDGCGGQGGQPDSDRGS